MSGSAHTTASRDVFPALQIGKPKQGSLHSMHVDHLVIILSRDLLDKGGVA